MALCTESSWCGVGMGQTTQSIPRTRRRAGVRSGGAPGEQSRSWHSPWRVHADPLGDAPTFWSRAGSTFLLPRQNPGPQGSQQGLGMFGKAPPVLAWINLWQNEPSLLLGMLSPGGCRRVTGKSHSHCHIPADLVLSSCWHIPARTRLVAHPHPSHHVSTAPGLSHNREGWHSDIQGQAGVAPMDSRPAEEKQEKKLRVARETGRCFIFGVVIG